MLTHPLIRHLKEFRSPAKIGIPFPRRYSLIMSITAQKALLIVSKGAPFTVGQHEIPAPKAGEILVRIQATALNPVDWKIQQSGVYVETYPAILGTDSAGIVEAVGEGVTNFAVGDRV